jgi:hypothetical protein
MDEVLRDLARLRRTGTALSELMAELAQAAPQRSEGSDSTGAVQAVLGHDGVPEAIRVSSYWKEKLPAAALGAAVTAACQAALQNRGAAWAEVLQRSGWDRRLGSLDDDSAATDTGATTADANPVPPAYRHDGGASARPLDVLAEEAMSTMDAAMRPVPAAAARQGGTGVNRGGTLEITLGPAGQVSCRVDPGWAARQSGVQLSQALAAALTTARGQMTAAARAAADGAAAGETSRQNLLTEILSVLNDPEHLAER